MDDKTDIEKLADAKNLGSQFMKGAPLAVAVLGDPMRNDCWVEDGSIAAVSMQYQAEELGLGSCWVQMRARGLDDGTPADEVIRGILNIPANYSVLCIVAFEQADGVKPIDLGMKDMFGSSPKTVMTDSTKHHKYKAVKTDAGAAPPS